MKERGNWIRDDSGTRGNISEKSWWQHQSPKLTTPVHRVWRHQLQGSGEGRRVLQEGMWVFNELFFELHPHTLPYNLCYCPANA